MIASATAPTGRFTKKTQCQLIWSVRKPPEGRPDDRRQPEHAAEEPLVLAALGGREQVADDGQRDREYGTGAEALEAAEEDELEHVGRQPGQERAEQEEPDADEQQVAPPELVGQLAVDGAR